MRETLPVGTDADSMRLDDERRMRAAHAVGLVAAVAFSIFVAATAIVEVRFDVDLSGLEQRFPWLVAGPASIALVLLAAGVWFSWLYHPWASVGLAGAGLAALLPIWAAGTWMAPSVRAGVLAALPLTAVGLVLVALRWSGEWSGRKLVGSIGVLAAGASLIHLLAYDPFVDPGCARTCEHVDPLLAGVVSSRAAVGLGSVLAAGAALGVVVAVLWARLPRTPSSIVVAVITAGVGLALVWLVRWLSWGDAAVWGAIPLVVPASVAIVAGAVCVVETRAWRTRAAVTRLAAGLSTTELGHGALGGGILGVHFAMPDEDRWVDAAGHDAPSTATGTAVVVRHEGDPLLRLVLARGADPAAAVAALTPASRLALRNTQLSAVALARVADLHASQRRIVVSADTERRRIERDLHDGAQQRLVGVSFQLRIARSRVDAATEEALQSIEERVGAALARLRELAHGMFPRALAEEGLEAALEDLVGSSSTGATLDIRLAAPVSAEAATAAYATVAAALREAPIGGSPRVTLATDDGDLVLRVQVAGGGRSASEFTEVADRVGAAGGRLTVDVLAGGTLNVGAVIPCGL